MAKQLAFRVTNVRSDFDWCLLIGDLNIGYQDGEGPFVGLLEVRGCVLKNGSKGKWLQFPSKPRMRSGEHQKDDQGRPIYDNVVDLFMELGAGNSPDKRAPTKEAWKCMDYLVGLFTAALETSQAENGGRGGARGSSAPRASAPRSGRPQARAVAAPAGASVRTMDAPQVVDEDDDPIGVSDDDDLPF